MTCRKGFQPAAVNLYQLNKMLLFDLISRKWMLGLQRLDGRASVLQLILPECWAHTHVYMHVAYVQFTAVLTSSNKWRGKNRTLELKMYILIGCLGYKYNKTSTIMSGCRNDSVNQSSHVNAPPHSFNSRTATFNLLVCVSMEDN